MKSKSLIRYVKKNAKQIKSKNEDIQYDMMNNPHSCVLRPFGMPNSIKWRMTEAEYQEYKNKSYDFDIPQDIDRAIKWVEQWVNK